MKRAYKYSKSFTTSLRSKRSMEGEPLEKKIRRMLENNEPIEATTPIIFTERKDGVLPEYNIRTDKQELAIEAQSVVQKGKIAKREKSLGERAQEGMKKESKDSGGPGSTQGTEQ